MNTPAEILSRPLIGVRVLVTRAQRDSTGLRSRLSDLGAVVVEVPLLDFEPPEEWTPLDNALRALGSFEWIVFTSRIAVEAVFERLSHLKNVAALGATQRVAAIGPATASALKRRGIDPHIVPRTQTALGVAESMITFGISERHVLIPSSDRARTDLREALERAGAHVHQVVAYRTVRPPIDDRILDQLRQGEIDVVALASPSALENLVTVLGPDKNCLRQTALACIGPTTAKAVRDRGFEPAGLAPQQTLDGLVNVIVEIVATEEFRDQPG